MADRRAMLCGLALAAVTAAQVSAQDTYKKPPKAVLDILDAPAPPSVAVSPTGEHLLFVQSDRAVDSTHGGLGIGLTLVKRLTEMHGGTVTAFSEGPGKGSRFVIRLPLEARVPAAPRAMAPTPYSSSPLRVLVVDDNRDSTDSLALLLGALGHQVRTAYDGPQALAQLAWPPLGPALARLHDEVLELDRTRGRKRVGPPVPFANRAHVGVRLAQAP